MRTNKRKFRLALTALVLVALSVPVVAISGTITLDSFDSEGIPYLKGQLTTDGESLFLEVRADPMAVSGNNAYMAALFYTGDAEPEGFSGPWDDAYLLNDNWFTAGPQGNVQWGIGLPTNHPWSNQGALPLGVELDYVVDSDVGIWTMTIPYDAIGAKLGDTISYMVQARYQDVENRFAGVNLSLNQSHGDAGFNPLYFSENYQTVSLEVVKQMATFVIDHAKIDFKKKPNDDKVDVKGTLALDANGEVDISEDVTVTVGPLSETIRMVEKGKKGDKWEYKRPKGGAGDIKHMTIDWKNGKFDIRMDKADLSGLTDPNNVTISVQIGDDVGEETIPMREKKHHWDYKAEKPKKTGPAAIELLVTTDEVKVVAYPNPIRDVDTATFQVMGTLATQVEEIRVQIYDLSGRLVWKDTALGSELDWHTDSLSGDYLANGIYLYSVQVRIGGNWINQDTGKIAVLR